MSLRGSGEQLAGLVAESGWVAQLVSAAELQPAAGSNRADGWVLAAGSGQTSTDIAPTLGQDRMPIQEGSDLLEAV